MLHSHRFLLICLFYVLGISVANAQLILRSGESFLSGENIKKIIITYDDHTVWALTASGIVYYKPMLAGDFSIYPQTVGELVDDLAGYSTQDIYFSVKPKRLIHVKNGNKNMIPLDDPEITKINGIAVKLDGMKNTESYPDVDDYWRDDRLVVATDKYLYRIIRNDNTVMLYDIYREQGFDFRGYKITKSGIKGVEFKVNLDVNYRCGWPQGESVIQHIDYTIYVSNIPQHDPYGDFNCTMFNYDKGSDYMGINQNSQYWGTNNGLYIQYWGRCGIGLTQPIKNEQINSIEELRMFNVLSPTTFVLAASNTGLFYTEKFVKSMLFDWVPIEEVSFKKLPGLNARVNNFAIDYRSFSPEGSRPAYDPRYICENVIWLATDQGVKKVYPQLDGAIYEEKLLARFTYDKDPDMETAEESIFTLCGNESLEVNANFTDPINNGAISIHWTKNGVDLPEWAGKSVVRILDKGRYRAELIGMCEGVSMHSKNFVINTETTPEITFNYPAKITLCEGNSKELSTIDKPGYTYRWFKDDAEIVGESVAKLKVSSKGSYRVEVSNCAGSFVTSSAVAIDIAILSAPIITPNKSTYCFGDIALLKIENTQSHKIHWYKDGIELRTMENKTEIQVSSAGIYEAIFENIEGCKKKSNPFNLQIYPFPVISVNTVPTKSLCYGESASLSVSTAPNSTYRWNTGATTSSIQVNQAGNYFVEVTSAFGCTTKSNVVNVLVNDRILLTEPLDSKICTTSGEQVTLIAEPGYLSYNWNGLTSSSNAFAVTKPGDYKLTVTDVNGCTAKVIYKVVSWCKEIIVANAFTPNGDGINDLWYVAGLENDPSAMITIYNRYGVLVFQTKGLNPVWDGSYKGTDVPVGVYYYQIKSSKSDKPLKGSVTLIR